MRINPDLAPALSGFRGPEQRFQFVVFPIKGARLEQSHLFGLLFIMFAFLIINSHYRGNSMKICPRCQKTYTDDNLNFCLEDGTVLTPASAASLPDTLLMGEPRPTQPQQPMPSQRG